MVTCCSQRSRFQVRSRTLSHPNRLATLYMTICACLTDSYDSTNYVQVTLNAVCATLYGDDREHEDFHAEHPVAAAQGKPWG